MKIYFLRRISNSGTYLYWSERGNCGVMFIENATPFLNKDRELADGEEWAEIDVPEPDAK